MKYYKVNDGTEMELPSKVESPDQNLTLSNIDYENMTLTDLERPEYLEPITLFKAYSDIMASEEILEFLY